jgi:hypothetical protein
METYAFLFVAEIYHYKNTKIYENIFYLPSHYVYYLNMYSKICKYLQNNEDVLVKKYGHLVEKFIVHSESYTTQLSHIIYCDKNKEKEMDDLYGILRNKTDFLTNRLLALHMDLFFILKFDSYK